MWKVIAFLLALFLIGHFAIRYVRNNPLGPKLVAGEIAVESQNYSVRFSRNGSFSGTYFVSDAQSTDWSDAPVNLRLRVFDRGLALDYMRSYPDFHRYGADSSTRVEDVATPLGVIAANRAAYGDLRALLDQHESRQSRGGEHLCLTVRGESLTLASARSLEDDHDATTMIAQMDAGGALVYADQVEVADCKDALAQHP